jgi:hypothetical protein
VPHLPRRGRGADDGHRLRRENGIQAAHGCSVSFPA